MSWMALLYSISCTRESQSRNFRTSASADHPSGLLTRGFGPDRPPFFPAPIFRFALLAALARSACEPASRLKRDRGSVPDLFSARRGPIFLRRHFSAPLVRFAHSRRCPSVQPLAQLPLRSGSRLRLNPSLRCPSVLSGCMEHAGFVRSVMVDRAYDTSTARVDS